MFSRITTKFTIDENRSAYWVITTNFTTRPVKLLLDSGAQITLIAKELFTKELSTSERYTLSGFNSRAEPGTTNGFYDGEYITKNGTHWPARVHAVDRDFAGPFDGYLGMDFILEYNAILDFGAQKMTIHAGIGIEKQHNDNVVNEPRGESTSSDPDSDASPFFSAGAEYDPSMNESMEGERTENHIKKQDAQKEIEEAVFVRPLIWNFYDPESNKKAVSKQKCTKTNENENLATATNGHGGESDQDRPIEPNLADQIHGGEHDQDRPMESTKKNQNQNKSQNRQQKTTISTEPTESQELKKAKCEYDALLRDIDSKTFHETDDDVTKLIKLTRYKMKLNPQASAYIKYFGTKKVQQTNQQTKPKKIYTVNSVNRSQIIADRLKRNDMNRYEKMFIDQLTEDFPMQFYVEGDPLAETDIAKHEIHLKPGSGVVNVRQYRLPEAQRTEIMRKTKQLLEQNVIENSISPFNSPTFLVPKKDSRGMNTETRQVFDYRKLNEKTIMQKYPIPLIQELVDRFANAQFMSKLDIERAYHQIPMRTEHKEFTAFTVHFQKYQFNRMPFGLAGAPGTMQCGIINMLADLLDKGVSAYIDDVGIHTTTFEEHVSLLNEIYKRLKKHNLQVKIQKCEFFCKEIEYLGFIISPNQVRPNPIKSKAIVNFPIPKSRKQLQSFLGMTNYFRHFIQSYSHIARPLTRLTSAELKFEMDQHAIDAFEQLKNVMASKVMLNTVDYNKEFLVATDASDIAIGAVLTQEHDGKDRPIYFYSRALKGAELNYCTHEKELLAIVAALDQFEGYLRGRRFTVKTDSQCLVYLFGSPHKNKRLIRQAVAILDANFDVIYQPGKLNVVADALSRVIVPEEGEQWHCIPITDFIEKHVKPSKAINRITRSRAAAFADPVPTVRRLPTIMIKNGAPNAADCYDHIFSIASSSNKKFIKKLIDEKEINDKTVFKNISAKESLIVIRSLPPSQNEIESTAKIIETKIIESKYEKVAIYTDFKAKALFSLKFVLMTVLEQMEISINIHLDQIIELFEIEDQINAMNMHHQLKLGGHAGVQRMKETMKRIYYWPSMAKDIKRFVDQCAICEKAKVTRYTKMPMQITSTGTRPFEHVYLDHVGPINPPSDQGHKHIFVATCDLTKYAIALPVEDTTAECTSDCFIKGIILQFGFPVEVSHDGGPAFTSGLFKELNKKLKLKDITTTPYNPRANIVERRNRSMVEYLRCYTQQKPGTWAELLPYCTFAYNITVNSTTGFAPFELVYGRGVTLPDAITRSKPVYNYDNYAELCRKELHDAWKLAAQMNEMMKQKNKVQYDKKVNEVVFKPNDKILVKKIIKDKKFDFVWNGPFTITEVFPKYVIYEDGNKKKKIGKDYIKLSRTANAIQYATIPESQQMILHRVLFIKRNTHPTK